ncbi:MAG: FHIPEP family type III secretion protein [Phycisphaerae bacterium]|nr:FHIPEP family type III secretion protein [Phycisphaerae bacterium]
MSFPQRDILTAGAATSRRLVGLIVPAAAAAMLFVVLVPMHPAVMDVLLAASIALAGVIFLTTIFIATPLEFSVFPSLLLGATLLRLVLNIATTRLILTAGDGRSFEQAHLAAGRVIWSFSEFVASGSLAVGVILFSILAVIQFVVITKGATRISEVAARFVLDAMPGKQMAIDADLAANLIDEAEARRRREKISAEADFYGAMDGASKFLRGDAVAAVLITLVNIFGGLYVGLVQYGWAWDRTVGLFTRLTIGDGLTSQIPALLVSVSAALMVTRSTARMHLGEQVVKQLTSRPAALLVTAVFLAALTLTSLPATPLLLLAAGCVALAWYFHTRTGSESKSDTAENPRPETPAPGTPSREIEKALAVHPLQMELGYALIRLVDETRGGDLVSRIDALRRRIASDLGFVMPPVRVRDEMRLGSHDYRISLRGSLVARGRLQPGRLFVTGPADALAMMRGLQARRPCDEAEGVWVSPNQQGLAEKLGLRTEEAPDLLITHLDKTVRRGAAELLTRQATADRIETLRATARRLVDDVEEKLHVGRVQRVLQRLLAEGISIRDLESILETLSEAAEHTDSLDEQLQAVRRSLSPRLHQHREDHTMASRESHEDSEMESFGSAVPEGFQGYYESEKTINTLFEID